MAKESYQSTRVGDAKYKIQMASAAKDKTVSIMNGGNGGGSKGGYSNESLLKLGRGVAKAAANGKGY